MSKITVTTIAGATSGADANKVKIESGDQLGVGTTPTHPLTVNGQIKSIGANGETVQLQTSSQYTGLSFVGSDGTRDAIIDYDHTGGFMTVKAHTTGHNIRFTTGGYSERFRITDNGVTFNGDTAAANALDDYEEGTFTPVLYFGGGTTGITYSSGRQLGQYTKIGDSVFIYIHIQLTSKGSAAGAVQIHNLPFTVKSGGHHYIPAKTWIAAMASLNETPTFRFMTANTVMDCYQMSSNTYSTVTNSNCTNTTAFQIAGHYFV